MGTISLKGFKIACWNVVSAAGRVGNFCFNLPRGWNLTHRKFATTKKRIQGLKQGRHFGSRTNSYGINHSTHNIIPKNSNKSTFPAFFKCKKVWKHISGNIILLIISWTWRWSLCTFFFFSYFQNSDRIAPSSGRYVWHPWFKIIKSKKVILLH